jgi:molybdenum cofactor biosynthesis enzyme MoaA
MIYLLPERQSTLLRASVSSICNFSCQYCATDLGMENHTPPCIKAPLLNAKEYIQNMKMIAQHGFKAISFTGGEPLLNPEFKEILRECRVIFEKIEITTNGSKLLEHMSVIKECVDVLKISIDAFDPELRIKIARNPKAADITQIIEQCCEAGIRTIGFNFVYMKQNEAELPKLVDFASQLKKKYGTEIYISVLDLYYSNANRAFWQEQFVDLAKVRDKFASEGRKINRRLRVGCDSYNFLWNDIVVNMKDSLSCTHRAKMCGECKEYCQEGIYSLKHSASGWISVCPSNNPEFGFLLSSCINPQVTHSNIDRYVEILNEIERIDHTGEKFFRSNHLEVRYE